MHSHVKNFDLSQSIAYEKTVGNEKSISEDPGVEVCVLKACVACFKRAR